MEDMEKMELTEQNLEPAKEEVVEPEKEKGIVKKILSGIGIMVMGFVLILIGQLVGSLVEIPFGIYAGIKGVEFLELPDAVITGLFYGEFIGIWIVVLLFFKLRKRNRPLFKALWTKPAGNSVKGLLIGCGIGFVTNAICILTAWLHKDIYLTFDSFSIIPLLIVAVMVFIQSSAEELICRAYIYQKFIKEFGSVKLAIIGNALLFGILHLGNEGVTVLSILNIIIVGVQFSLMVYYMDSLWAAFAAHAAWNYTQNIIFGLPNSGNVMPFSIFKLDASTAMDSFAYNVGFGVEGTILADAVLILTCVLIWLWGRKHGKKPTNIWE